MPASETQSQRRGGPLFTVLFWAGVSLAPLAALMLLIGQGEGPLRIAAVLAVLAVVLIGLSITLRKDTETVRLEMEETLLDEVDILREDVRQDIAAAARAQHRQFSEKLQMLYESIEALRGQAQTGATYGRSAEPAGQVAAGQHAGGQVAGGQFAGGQFAGGQPVGGQSVGGQGGTGSTAPGGRAAGSASVGPGRPAATPGGHASAPMGPGPVGSASVGSASVGAASVGSASVGHSPVGSASVGHSPVGYSSVGQAAAGHAAAGQAAAGHASAGHASAGYASAGYGHTHAGMPPPAPPVVGGVVRHTETVQVTTRSTIVDPHGGDGHAGRGTVYGGTTYGHAPEPPTAPGGRDWREPAEESWTEQRLRERLGGFDGRGFDGRAFDSRGFEARGFDTAHGADSRGFDGARGADSRGFDTRGADSRGFDGARGADSRGFDTARGSEPRRPRPYERDDGPAADDRWAGMRAGDRWTSVRTDDRGREVHMGERRSAMQSDDTGTELRIEDRWASVRRDEPRRWSGPAEDRWPDDRWAPEAEDTGQYRGSGETERSGRGRPAGGTGSGESEWSGWLSGDRDRPAGHAALPASSSEPSWADSWEDQSRDARGRQRDDGDAFSWRAEVDEPQPARVRQRRLDFELSDDRWG